MKRKTKKEVKYGRLSALVEQFTWERGVPTYQYSTAHTSPSSGQAKGAVAFLHYTLFLCVGVHRKHAQSKVAQFEIIKSFNN